MEVRDMRRYIKPITIFFCLAVLVSGVLADGSSIPKQSAGTKTTDAGTTGDDAILGKSLGSGTGSSSRATGLTYGNEYESKTDVDYAQVAEDTEIMAKIIDKALQAKFPDEYKSASMFREFQGCQGIYLRNHGAIFMTNIGFPVAEYETSDQEAATDDLWKQTRSELKGANIGGAYSISFPDKDADGGYDSEKVEKLKKELLRLIGEYASNIRNLGSRENVVIAVRGSSGSVNRVETVMYKGPENIKRTEQLPALQSKNMPESAKEPPKPGEPTPTVPSTAKVMQGESGVTAKYDEKVKLPTAPEPSGTVTALIQKPDGNRYTMIMSDGRDKNRTTLTISVSKGNILAYKDGKLNLDELKEKAEITQY
jgi:hypothetical protein